MTHLKITGMTCDSCAAHVKEALEKVPGVQSALVSYPKGTAQLATLSGTWNRFNFRYYTFALIFVIFDVEVVFLFPWAAKFGVLSSEFGAFVLAEMAVFIAILLVGWLYAWRKGALEWS